MRSGTLTSRPTSGPWAALPVCLALTAHAAADCYAFYGAWSSVGGIPDTLLGPTALAVSPSGNVYVADTANSRVLMFTPSGGFLGSYGSAGVGDDQFQTPRGVAVDGNGTVYVADTDGDRVVKLAADGSALARWGVSGAGDGELNYPCGPALDGGSRLYVADRDNHRIMVFTTGGALVSWWGRDSSGGAGAHPPGSGLTPRNGGHPGEFTYPRGVAVGPDGSIYVADTGNHRVQVFDPDGVLLRSWGSLGPAADEMNDPTGIAVDGAGRVFVADRDNHRIQVFSSTGTPLTRWGLAGSGSGQLSSPEGVAVAADGVVFVADTRNNRVHYFRPVQGAPPAPSGLQVEAKQSSELLVTWQENSDTEEGYLLQRAYQTGPGRWSAWADIRLPADSAHLHDGGLQVGTPYRYRVACFNADGQSAWSPTGSGQTAVGAAPTLKLTSVPAYGTTADLAGVAANITPSAYRVATYVYMGGWWTKPSFALPLAPISPDGTFTCDITTGGTDELASRIIAFLWPASAGAPPAHDGDAALSQALYDTAADWAEAVREPPPPRTVLFSGYVWNVKTGYAGPGPNHFSDDPANVWVDDQGRLHLRILYDADTDQWRCSEVVCARGFGYGRYTFEIDSAVGDLHEDVVLGLFTWSNTEPYSHRELDIEFTRWHEPNDPLNAQYVVQPHSLPGHRERWTMPALLAGSSHRFTWLSDRVEFASREGLGVFPAAAGDSLGAWTFSDAAAVPKPGDETPRINLWLYSRPGVEDRGQVEREVIIRSFAFASDDGDAYEPDDTSAQAKAIVIGAAAQARHFHRPGDADWASLQAEAGVEYAIRTSVGTADTVLALFAPDGTTELAADDNGGADGASLIRWTCPHSGAYLIRVQDAAGETGTYELAVTKRPLSADLNGDGAFNETDWALFIAGWRTSHAASGGAVDPRCDLARPTAGGYEAVPDQRVTAHDALAFWELFVRGD